MINSVSGYNPNFTSKIHITGYNGASKRVTKFLKSSQFSELAKTLENNGKKDIVVINIDPEIDLQMYVKKGRHISDCRLLENPFDMYQKQPEHRHDILNAYKLCLKNLQFSKRPINTIPQKLDKYILY